ncbi:MAG: class I SAM-dependent methyltransferase [bacterium]
MFDERLVVNEQTKSNIIYDEHLARYEFARQFVSGKKVLDLACGTGYGAQLLAKAGAIVIAIDQDKQAIESAQQNFPHENITYLVDSAESLKTLEDNSIDIITSFETIEHLKNCEDYLKALTRVLRYDGIALISTPNKAFFNEKNHFHIKEFTKSELIALLGKYFANIKVLEQNNCICSYIMEKGQNEPFLANNHVITSNQPTQPLYFIAICSKDSKFSAKISNNIISLNPLALERWENNPGWKLVNKIYSIFKK